MQDKDRLDNQRGLDKEIQAKLAGKFDPKKAQACLDWIAECTGKKIEQTGKGVAADFQHNLRNGYLLGLTIKRIDKKKRKKSKWKQTNSSFPAREQIGKFVNYCKDFGMKDTDVCTPNDLYDGDNLNNVVNHIYALHALAQKKAKGIPELKGANMRFATENKREFDEATLRKGKNTIPMLTQPEEQDENKSSMDSYGIVKTNLQSADKSSVPFFNQGGVHHEKAKFDSHGIVKHAAATKSVAPGIVPKQSQGGIAHEKTKFDSHGIVKHAAATKSVAPGIIPKQSQGGIAHAKSDFDAQGIVKVKPDGTLVSKKV